MKIDEARRIIKEAHIERPDDPLVVAASSVLQTLDVVTDNMTIKMSCEMVQNALYKLKRAADEWRDEGARHVRPGA